MVHQKNPKSMHSYKHVPLRDFKIFLDEPYNSPSQADTFRPQTHVSSPYRYDFSSRLGDIIYLLFFSFYWQIWTVKPLYKLLKAFLAKTLSRAAIQSNALYIFN